jgi:hypothetical protein
MKAFLYYINLAHRVDRKEQILGEIDKIVPILTGFSRIEAVYSRDNGAIGCAASHLKALMDFVLVRSEPLAFVLEDDFEFVANRDELVSTLVKTLNDRSFFDVIQLSYNKPIAAGSGIPGIHRIYRSYTTSGYIVQRSFAYELLACFLEAHQLLISNVSTKPQHVTNELWAIDSWWNNFQARSRFMGFSPALGRQRASYSDVVRKNVDYGV